MAQETGGSNPSPHPFMEDDKHIPDDIPELAFDLEKYEEDLRLAADKGEALHIPYRLKLRVDGDQIERLLVDTYELSKVQVKEIVEEHL